MIDILTFEQEYHLQAVINAANVATSGVKTKQNYIPTPDVTKAKDVKYDELYPRDFREPATYIRFSSTVEDCVGVAYCMNETDAEFLAQLNDGKDVNGQQLKDKTGQCSEDAFEEAMNFFEESSQRIQPFANLDSAPLLSLEEMRQGRPQDDELSKEAERFLKPIYQYWASKKGSRPLMPTIKVRVLDTTSEADDADPYVCFRRREVRQTRKTRGRDAQVVEKLKKLRLELEQARQLVQLVRDREELNKTNLEISRRVFQQRRQLKEVKVQKNIVGEKGEDEELLVNQRPQPKPKAREGRPGPMLKLSNNRSVDRVAEDSNLKLLSELQADAEEHVQHTIDSRKEQHRRWNQNWQDRTWNPLTPPLETANQPPRWAPLFSEESGYPTPPPSLPSRSSQDRDGDVDMEDQKPVLDVNAMANAEPRFAFYCPLPDVAESCLSDHDSSDERVKRRRLGNPSVRLRYGRGGRLHLEVRKQKRRGLLNRGVVSDSDSDSDAEDYHPVSDSKTFDYRCALNGRAQQRPEGVPAERRQWPSGDQTAMMAQGATSQTPAVQITAAPSAS